MNVYIVITLGISILSVIFNIFLYFKKPQEDMDKKQAVADKEMEGKATTLAQKEIENKATILAQQLQWEKEANERRFTEMQGSIKESMTMAQNHLHTVDVKTDALAAFVNTMNLNLTTELARLSATIQERFPRV